MAKGKRVAEGLPMANWTMWSQAKSNMRCALVNVVPEMLTALAWTVTVVGVCRVLGVRL